MQCGYVISSPDLNRVLCLSADKSSFEMVKLSSTQVLNRAICVSTRTQAINIVKMITDRDDLKSVVKGSEINNIARLYKKFY